MVPFQIEIEWQHLPLSLLAEQLDNLADEEGFIRFDVREGARRAVIFVNVEAQPQIPAMQDPENYYEALHYPEHPGAFSFDNTFAAGEIRLIGEAIRQQFTEQHFLPDQTQLL